MEPTVLLVSEGALADSLVPLLEKQRLFVEPTVLDAVPGALAVGSPDLVVYLGHERAAELVALLAKRPAHERVRLAIVAERAALPELRKLDRELVVTVLSLDIPESALASRLATVARRVAARPGGPLAASTEAAVAVAQAAAAVAVAQAAAEEVAPANSAAKLADGFARRLKASDPPAPPRPSHRPPGAAPSALDLEARLEPPTQEKVGASSAGLSAAELEELLERETQITELSVLPSRAGAAPRAPLRRVVLADADVTRAVALAEALRSWGIEVVAVPPDPAATRWPLLQRVRPDGVLVDTRLLRPGASTWLELFRADAQLGRARVVALPFDRLLDETSGHVALRLLEAELGPPLDDERATLVRPEQFGVAPAAPTAAGPGASTSEASPGPVPSSRDLDHVLEELAPALASVPAPGESSTLDALPGLASPSVAQATPAPSRAPSAPGGRRWLLGVALATLIVGGGAGALVMTRGTAPPVRPPGPPSAVVASAPAKAGSPDASAARAAAPPASGDSAQAPGVSPNAAQVPSAAASRWVVPGGPARRCEEVATPPPAVNAVTLGVGTKAWERARQAMVRGDLEAAHVQLCEAVFNNPESLALEGLVQHYLTLHAPLEARRWVERALAVRPDRSKTRELVGDIESQLGEEALAREIWVRELGLGAGDDATLRQVAERLAGDAVAILRSGDRTRAELLARRAATLAPGSASAAATLAAVFLAAGHSNQARAWVARALELDPRLSEALVVEGDLALAAGDAVAARQSYQRATEARPNNQQAWQKLGALRP